ncbi:hypothetical protein DFH09DRAFT_1068985 [Mycena vulgaris]|nr:hypothetical protein DFH09DRAFT_1068985 [Mycena vulgaris]
MTSKPFNLVPVLIALNLYMPTPSNYSEDTVDTMSDLSDTLNHDKLYSLHYFSNSVDSSSWEAMQPSTRTEIQSTLQIIMDWSDHVQQKNASPTSNPTMHGVCGGNHDPPMMKLHGAMFGVGWHLSQEAKKKKTLVTYAPRNKDEKSLAMTMPPVMVMLFKGFWVEQLFTSPSLAMTQFLSSLGLVFNFALGPKCALHDGHVPNHYVDAVSGFPLDLLLIGVVADIFQLDEGMLVLAAPNLGSPVVRTKFGQQLHVLDEVLVRERLDTTRCTFNKLLWSQGSAEVDDCYILSQ